MTYPKKSVASGLCFSKKTTKTMLCVSFLIGLGGCASFNSPDATTGQSKGNSAAWGAGLGTLSGAVIGQMAGKDTKSTLIGAAIGGAMGAGIGYSLDQQEKDLRQELMNSGVQVKRNGNEIILLMRDKIAFATNQDQLQPQILPALKGVAKVLKRYPKTAMKITEFTDNTGGNSYNMLLSKSRAQSVSSYLLQKGLPSQRMTIQGVGPAYPLCSNETA